MESIKSKTSARLKKRLAIGIAVLAGVFVLTIPIGERFCYDGQSDIAFRAWNPEDPGYPEYARKMQQEKKIGACDVVAIGWRAWIQYELRTRLGIWIPLYGKQPPRH